MKNSVDKQVKTLHNQKTDRTIVFFPVWHIGKKRYFESSKKIVDSLKEKDFVVFYEGIGIQHEIDSSSLDTINRKLRKLLGFHLSESFKDTTNKSLSTAIIKNKYIMQDYRMMGVNLEKDFRVDVSKDELIRHYENDKNHIILTPCDFETPLKLEYKCKDSVKYSSFYAVHTLRNEHIVQEVLKSQEKKIILIYGKAHWKFIWPGLRDAGFEIVKGKMFL